MIVDFTGRIETELSLFHLAPDDRRKVGLRIWSFIGLIYFFARHHSTNEHVCSVHASERRWRTDGGLVPVQESKSNKQEHRKAEVIAFSAIALKHTCDVGTVLQSIKTKTWCRRNRRSRSARFKTNAPIEYYTSAP